MAKKTKEQRPGRLIKAASGYSAYVPDPPPHDIVWTPALVRGLSEADRLIGRLAGEGGRLPNPHLLMRPFIAREAVLSSRIEGTQATLGELLASEAGASIERSPDDLREVGNYVVALEYGMKRLQSLPLSLRLVRELHKKLMTGVRGNTARPGEFRRSQNWIGAPGSAIENATYVPPPPNEMVRALDAWEKFMHVRTIPPLVQIALGHYQFEAIHPFLDGNGRVGRLLITLFLVERKILPSPLLYLSAFFEATRREYYDRLRGVTEAGRWGDWVEYFLNGVARQSEDALSRAERINTILTKWQKQMAGSTSKAPSQVVDLLAENPFCTVGGVSQRLGVAFTTAQRAIDKLVRAKILERSTKAKRDRIFCARAVLDILEEPPRLS